MDGARTHTRLVRIGLAIALAATGFVAMTASALAEVIESKGGPGLLTERSAGSWLEVTVVLVFLTAAAVVLTAEARILRRRSTGVAQGSAAPVDGVRQHRAA